MILFGKVILPLTCYPKGEAEFEGKETGVGKRQVDWWPSIC